MTRYSEAKQRLAHANSDLALQLGNLERALDDISRLERDRRLPPAKEAELNAARRKAALAEALTEQARIALGVAQQGMAELRHEREALAKQMGITFRLWGPAFPVVEAFASTLAQGDAAYSTFAAQPGGYRFEPWAEFRGHLAEVARHKAEYDALGEKLAELGDE